MSIRIKISAILFFAGWSMPAFAAVMPADTDSVRHFEVVTIDIGNCLSHYYQGKSTLFYFSCQTDVNNLLDTWSCDKPELPEGLDFLKNDLLLIDYHGMDCKSRYAFDAKVDSIDLTYTFISEVTYGGCRAGGYYFHAWVLIPKIQNGYTVRYARHLLDETAKRDEFIIEKTYSKR
jgi:hypothetical protein